MHWLQQTLGNTANFLKKTAGHVSNGLNWLHQNILEPGVRFGKQFGGEVGKFAEGVGQAADAVNDVNQAYRNKNLSGDKLKRGFDNLKEGADRARSSAGGAINQIKGYIPKRMKMV